MSSGGHALGCPRTPHDRLTTPDKNISNFGQTNLDRKDHTEKITKKSPKNKCDFFGQDSFAQNSIYLYQGLSTYHVRS